MLLLSVNIRHLEIRNKEDKCRSDKGISLCKKHANVPVIAKLQHFDGGYYAILI